MRLRTNNQDPEMPRSSHPRRRKELAASSA
jgi:hypothetical protein